MSLDTGGIKEYGERPAIPLLQNEPTTALSLMHGFINYLGVPHTLYHPTRHLSNEYFRLYLIIVLWLPSQGINPGEIHGFCQATAAPFAVMKPATLWLQDSMENPVVLARARQGVHAIAAVTAGTV